MQTQRRRGPSVRRELPPAEEPRARADWTLHSRYELYRDRSRTTGRVAAFTLVFAALVLFRVLEPFHKLSNERVGKEAAVVALEGANAGAGQREERLARAVAAFEAASALFDEAPWRAEGADLAHEAAELRNAYSRIVSASAAELEQAVQELERAKPVRVGGLEPVSARAASFPRSASVQWAKPPEPPLSPRKKKEAERPLLSEEELRALEDFAEARRRLEELGLPALVGTRATPTPTPDPSLPTIASALETLGIEPARIVGFASVRERDEFTFAAQRERARAAAEAAVRDMLALGRSRVVEPLRAALADAQSARATSSLETFDAQLDEWAELRAQAEDFPERLAADPSLAVEFADSFDELVLDFAGAVRLEEFALGLDWEAAKSHAAGLADELDVANAGLAEVERRCASLVPSWLADVANPSLLMQVYPGALLAFLAISAYCAFLVRESYLGIFHSYPGNSALAEVRATSSPWTLARRNSAQNSLTLCLYLGGLALVWLAFERGTMLSADWVGLPDAIPWPFTLRTVEAAPWFGRAAFLAAAGGVVLTLLADDPVPRRTLRRV